MCWSISSLASFPGPAQLSVASSDGKLGGAWERGCKLMVYDSDDGVCLVCVGRKRSLRSLEIPLENLLSGIVFLSGEC